MEVNAGHSHKWIRDLRQQRCNSTEECCDTMDRAYKQWKTFKEKKKRTIILRIRKVKYLKYTRKEVSENLTLTENQG